MNAIPATTTASTSIHDSYCPCYELEYITSNHASCSSQGIKHQNHSAFPICNCTRSLQRQSIPNDNHQYSNYEAQLYNPQSLYSGMMFNSVYNNDYAHADEEIEYESHRDDHHAEIENEHHIDESIYDCCWSQSTSWCYATTHTSIGLPTARYTIRSNYIASHRIQSTGFKLKDTINKQQSNIDGDAGFSFASLEFTESTDSPSKSKSY
jgi:hypothetical protein